MRSLLVLILAAAAFMGFLFWNHFRAAEMRSTEDSAIDQLRRLAERPGREATESGGYRFRWERGGGLPDVLVAAPAERGEGGVRWFATPDGNAVYEFDTALFMTRGDPGLGTLRRFLALTVKQRESAELPPGWRLLE